MYHMNKKILIILILTACCFLYVYNIGARDFWAPDEGDFAQIAKELNNNLVVPHLNNTPYAEKPPLFYYVVFIFTKVFYWLPDETSMRLTSSFGGFAMIAVFFFVVLSSFDIRRALVATAILALSPLFYWQARYLQVDMVFASFLVISLLLFFRFMENGRPVSWYLFCLFLALAFMTKGPLSVALVAPVVLIYCATENKLPMVFEKRTVYGFLLFVVMVAPWYLAIYAQEGLPYLYENVLRQNFVRFYDAWSHKRPFYYYFTTLPLDFFPWSLFLPTGIYAAIKAWRVDNKVRFFSIWFLWFLFFLSLSSGKISKYMLPALPALAVIVSGAITDREALYNRIAFPVLSLIFVAMGIFLLSYRSEAYGEFATEQIILGSLGIVLGLILSFFSLSRRTQMAFASLVLLTGLIYMTGNMSVYYKWNRYKSPKALCDKIRIFVGDHTPWVYYGSIRGVYVYYTGRFAVHIDEHNTAHLGRYAEEKEEFFLLTRKRDASEIEGTIPGVRVVFGQKVGSTEMVFLHYKKR